MLEKIASRVQRFVVNVVTWQVNRRYERAAMHLLEQAHLGASLGWLSDIVEERGRHALAVAVHH